MVDVEDRVSARKLERQTVDGSRAVTFTVPSKKLPVGKALVGLFGSGNLASYGHGEDTVTLFSTAQRFLSSKTFWRGHAAAEVTSCKLSLTLEFHS